jgi:hypothetical protein
MHKHRLPLRAGCSTQIIFCDESGLSDRFIVLGALSCVEHRDKVEEQIKEVKKRYALYSEIKWEKLPSKPGKFLDGYNAVLDLFLESTMTFKALIVDTARHPMNHAEYTGGSYATGYYQFYGLLLFNGIIKNCPDHNSHVILHTPAYPGRKHFRSIEADINAQAIRHQFPKMDSSSCCYVDSQSTKDSSGVQLVDLLTGIVSAAWNKSVTSQIKLRFIEGFEGKLGIKIDSNSKTRHEDQKYNRWLFKPNTTGTSVT